MTACMYALLVQFLLALFDMHRSSGCIVLTSSNDFLERF